MKAAKLDKRPVGMRELAWHYFGDVDKVNGIVRRAGCFLGWAMPTVVTRHSIPGVYDQA